MTAVYGVLGLDQAVQNAVNVIWAVPRNQRPDPFGGRLRSGALLSLAGLTVISFATLTVLTGSLAQPPGEVATGMGWLVSIGSILVITALLTLSLRPAITPRPPLKRILPGAFFIAIGWHVLERLGGIYVNHVLARASELNRVFAFTLGLIGLIYAASVIAVLGAEVNGVSAHRLYPRSLQARFSDSAELTAADRRAYTLSAQSQRYKSTELIEVTFDPPST